MTCEVNYDKSLSEGEAKDLRRVEADLKSSLAVPVGCLDPVVWLARDHKTCRYIELRLVWDNYLLLEFNSEQIGEVDNSWVIEKMKWGVGQRWPREEKYFDEYHTPKREPN